MLEWAEFVDVYWDDELDEPAWVVRRGTRSANNIIIHDADVIGSGKVAKQHAEQIARRWRRNLRENKTPLKGLSRFGQLR